jgi:hypothetical protein
MHDKMCFIEVLNAVVFYWLRDEDDFQDCLESIVIEGGSVTSVTCTVRYTTWWKYGFPGHEPVISSQVI